MLFHLAGVLLILPAAPLAVVWLLTPLVWPAKLWLPELFVYCKTPPTLAAESSAKLNISALVEIEYCWRVPICPSKYWLVTILDNIFTKNLPWNSSHWSCSCKYKFVFNVVSKVLLVILLSTQPSFSTIGSFKTIL